MDPTTEYIVAAVGVGTILSMAAFAAVVGVLVVTRNRRRRKTFRRIPGPWNVYVRDTWGNYSDKNLLDALDSLRIVLQTHRPDWATELTYLPALYVQFHLADGGLVHPRRVRIGTHPSGEPAFASGWHDREDRLLVHVVHEKDDRIKHTAFLHEVCHVLGYRITRADDRDHADHDLWRHLLREAKRIHGGSPNSN